MWSLISWILLWVAIASCSNYSSPSPSCYLALFCPGVSGLPPSTVITTTLVPITIAVPPTTSTTISTSFMTTGAISTALPTASVRNFGCKGLSYWFDLALVNDSITTCLNAYPDSGGINALAGYTSITPSLVSNLNLIMPNCTCVVASYYLGCFSRQNCTLPAVTNAGEWMALVDRSCGPKLTPSPLASARPPVWRNSSTSDALSDFQNMILSGGLVRFVVVFVALAMAVSLAL